MTTLVIVFALVSCNTLGAISCEKAEVVTSLGSIAECSEHLTQLADTWRLAHPDREIKAWTCYEKPVPE